MKLILGDSPSPHISIQHKRYHYTNANSCSDFINCITCLNVISNGFADYNHELLEVGVSNNISLGNPDIITMPARGSYHICAYSNESSDSTDRGHLSLSCKADTPPGRYVIVRTGGADQGLAICEISVYEKGNFKQQKQ